MSGCIVHNGEAQLTTEKNSRVSRHLLVYTSTAVPVKCTRRSTEICFLTGIHSLIWRNAWMKVPAATTFRVCLLGSHAINSTIYHQTLLILPQCFFNGPCGRCSQRLAGQTGFTLQTVRQNTNASIPLFHFVTLISLL